MQTIKGLSDAQVAESRLKYGSNILTPPPRESWVKLLLEKFNDPIIKLLLVATLLSLVTGYFNGSMVESLGIIIAVLLATFLAFVNEYKAGKEFDILNKINDKELVKVYRNGGIKQVPKDEIVVGDIVIVEIGDEVPADGKLIQSLDLSVNESSLNGESKPSSKTHAAVDSFSGAYSPNNLYKGTTVAEGNGIMQVTAVGDSTEIGKTARQANELTGAKTPLNKQLDRLGKVISILGFTVAALTFTALVVRDMVLGILTPSLTLQNVSLLLNFFMIAVTLIVVAVPEGLAMSVTLSLAYSMRKLTANNALVRKMHACETMGATTVICTDKTGTLTQNMMTVVYSSFEFNESYCRQVALNSTAFLEAGKNGYRPVGNPTEGALLMTLGDNNVSYEKIRESFKIVKRLQFSTNRKYMATLVDLGDNLKLTLYIKGAPEMILDRCEMSLQERDETIARISKYQAKGNRCLAFAVKEIPLLDGAYTNLQDLCDAHDFTFTGFVAIADPIRSDVPDAMATCLNAGIQVKIVTGDTSLTAVEIARQSGLWKRDDTLEKNHITGADFENLTDEQARGVVHSIKVMSRARPADKMRLVRLLQESGEVVAVTGDGTNDAPALNYADVGLAMGSGTAVAKEASDIILLDDSFASVTKAVQWGRSIYLNIQKFIQFQLTINVVAVLTALAGPFIGIEFPLTVTQMLWVNLIMDTFAALALATEPSYRNVMKQKPRRVENFIISKIMYKHIFGWGLFFLAMLTGLLMWYNRDGGISNHDLSLFFTAFVMLQFWNMFNARTLGSSNSAFFKLLDNKSFLFIALVIVVLQVLIVQFGGNLFRTTPLSVMEWITIISLTSLVLWVGEAYRGILRLTKK